MDTILNGPHTHHDGVMTINQTSILEPIDLESDSVVACVRNIQCEPSAAPGLFLDTRTQSTFTKSMDVCWIRLSVT